jgi:glycosyltransferase involved in cell wall biosynthesis
MDNRQKVTLHFIQDIPTPHNNVLLKALREDPCINLRVWYACLTHPQYSFKPELAHAAGAPSIYGRRFPSWHLIKTVLLCKEDKFFTVGWMNPTTRILLILFWILRRPYNMWFDLPADSSSSVIKRILRGGYYWLLKNSNTRVFSVGKKTIQYFLDIGIPAERLVNLPIFVELPGNLDEYRKSAIGIRAKYAVRAGDLFIVTGSRLVFAKGFDLLLQALGEFDDSLKERIKVLIIGKGPEKVPLMQQVKENNLAGAVTFEDWMSNEDFLRHLCAADLAVHPARFDAYGGITLSAMGAGIPVIASNQAGSAIDRVIHGVNGWLYESTDVSALQHWLVVAFENRELLRTMGVAARRMAEEQHPSLGARRIFEKAI